MKKICLILTLALSLSLLYSCNDPAKTAEEEKAEQEAQKQKEEQELAEKLEKNTRLYVNTFAYSMMKTYYLWVDKIESALNAWLETDEPKAKIKEIRYKDSAGNDIDKWTALYDNFEEVASGVAGVSTTFGYELAFYWANSAQTAIYGVVELVYADSPAANAGLKRGDVIAKMNGSAITSSNYTDLYYASSYKYTLLSGATGELEAVEMYENPVITYKTFDCDGKKVGYLFYNSFNNDSYTKLIEACKYFKEEGCKELILDLRYNGGGYVFIETALASMIVPQKYVDEEAIFQMEQYNETLTKAWGADTTRFASEHKLSSGDKTYDFSTADANIGLEKLHVIYTGSSASASESIVCGLKPYMDVTIYGKQSYGKYLSGIMYGAEDWYEYNQKYLSSLVYENGLEYAKDWGIYVMIAIYTDVNGETGCMPDGYTPDYEVADDPTETYQLGDEKEQMLNLVLSTIGKSDLETRSDNSATRSAGAGLGLKRFETEPHSRNFGMHIIEKPSCPAQETSR